MISKICKRYLESYETRSNITVISEVLSALIIDKFLIKDNIICVGDNQQEKLPDIFTIDKMLGFEVMRCESKLDFDHDDFQKLLDVINYNYQIYQSIIKAKSYKKFSKIIKKEDFIKLKSFNFKITFDNNRITSSTHGVFFS